MINNILGGKAEVLPNTPKNAMVDIKELQPIKNINVNLSFPTAMYNSIKTETEIRVNSMVSDNI